MTQTQEQDQDSCGDLKTGTGLKPGEIVWIGIWAYTGCMLLIASRGFDTILIDSVPWTLDAIATLASGGSMPADPPLLGDWLLTMMFGILPLALTTCTFLVIVAIGVRRL